MSRIGEKISSLRQAKNLNRKQLGKLVGVSEKFVEEVEWGKRILNSDLIRSFSKALDFNLDHITQMELETDIAASAASPESEPSGKVQVKGEVSSVWSDAFQTVLKTVPVYGYDLIKVLDEKLLPIVANKVEGIQKDKVAFLAIQDNEMTGFRIAKGDLALVQLTHDIENNAICLVEYNGKRAVRQVKLLEKDRVLLISNESGLRADTAAPKNVRMLAKLHRLEIKL